MAVGFIQLTLVFVNCGHLLTLYCLKENPRVNWELFTAKLWWVRSPSCFLRITVLHQRWWPNSKLKVCILQMFTFNIDTTLWNKLWHRCYQMWISTFTMVIFIKSSNHLGQFVLLLSYSCLAFISFTNTEQPKLKTESKGLKKRSTHFSGRWQ